MSRQTTVLVKTGGELLLDDDATRRFIDEIGELRKSVRVVVCHGGGPQISAAMEAAGLAPEFKNGLRVTDARSIAIAAQVVLGAINTPLVAAFNARGIPAAGMSGADGGSLQVEAEDPALGFVGRIVKTDAALPAKLLDGGYVPVIAPLGLGPEGALYNVNADLVAGAFAGALHVEQLFIITNVRGLYRTFGREETFIPHTHSKELLQFIADGSAAAGMLPKLRGVLGALEKGVGRACLIDGRSGGALLRAFRGEDSGTVITHER